MPSVKARMDRMEKIAAKHLMERAANQVSHQTSSHATTTSPTSSPSSNQMMTMHQWLDIFEKIAPVAVARGETDMPTAIHLLKTAMEQANTQGNNTSSTQAASHGISRRPVEWEWCSEIYTRIVENRRPVTEREYIRLVAWYERHRLARPDGSPGINDPNITMMVHGYYRGPRRMGATETVGKLKRLRAMHPELPDVPADPAPTLAIPAVPSTRPARSAIG